MADVEHRVDRVEATLTGLRRKIDKLWAAREKDKQEARADNERRHRELMAAVKEINGDVRDHSNRLAKIETRHAIADQAASERPDNVMLHDPRKLAAVAGAAGGGLPSLIALMYVLWQIFGGG